MPRAASAVSQAIVAVVAESSVQLTRTGVTYWPAAATAHRTTPLPTHVQRLPLTCI